MLTIEQATIDDLEALVPLFEAYRDFYKCSPDEAGARVFLRDRLSNNESTVFLAWDSGEDDAGPRRAVGFTQLYPTWGSLELGPAWLLYDLYVDPSVRRGGVGRLLLDRGVEHARVQGGKFVLLETAVDNAPAQALYEAAGWKRDEEFFTYLFEL